VTEYVHLEGSSPRREPTLSGTVISVVLDEIAGTATSSARAARAWVIPYYVLDDIRYEMPVGRRCKVCRLGHRLRESIDQRLVHGESVRGLYKQLPEDIQAQFSRDSMQRHAQNHLPDRLSLYRNAEERRMARLAEDLEEETARMVDHLDVVDEMMMEGSIKLKHGQMEINAGHLITLTKFRQELEDQAGEQQKMIGLLQRIIIDAIAGIDRVLLPHHLELHHDVQIELMQIPGLQQIFADYHERHRSPRAILEADDNG
jgi:hypothetical protein